MEVIDFYEMNRISLKKNGLGWTKPRPASWQERPTELHEHAIDKAQYQRSAPRLNICESGAELLPLKFKRLLSEWKTQAAHLSSIKAKIIVPAYLEIIGMGQPALRLILNELKERPTYLFPALRAITGVDPVKPGDKGKLRQMANTWIEWGRQHNIIE
jgi:hypothetical protein